MRFCRVVASQVFACHRAGALASTSSRWECWIVPALCLALDLAPSARPCGLQTFAPLPAGVFCPLPLSWLRDGATLSDTEHLCRWRPMQCPLVSFSWEG